MTCTCAASRVLGSGSAGIWWRSSSGRDSSAAAAAAAGEEEGVVVAAGIGEAADRPVCYCDLYRTGGGIVVGSSALPEIAEFYHTLHSE